MSTVVLLLSVLICTAAFFTVDEGNYAVVNILLSVMAFVATGAGVASQFNLHNLNNIQRAFCAFTGSVLEIIWFYSGGSDMTMSFYDKIFAEYHRQHLAHLDSGEILMRIYSTDTGVLSIILLTALTTFGVYFFLDDDDGSLRWIFILSIILWITAVVYFLISERSLF